METPCLDAKRQTTWSAALREAGAQCRAAGVDSPVAVAAWLLSSVLNTSRLALYAWPDRVLDGAQEARFREGLARAVRLEPVQYIAGETDFMGLNLRCDARALIPRPETEQVVDWVLQDAHVRGCTAPTVADIGTGTGCIALALARAWPHAQVVAVDVMEDALALARENARRNGLAERVTFRLGSLLDGFADASLDMVMANLPYVATRDWMELPPEIRHHEPRSALDGGADGLQYICPLIDQARRVLRSGGVCCLEIGAEQGAPVRDELFRCGFRDPEVKQDWAGRDRMARGINP